MRSIYTILLLVALVFGAGYWYQALGDVCAVPLGYSIGEIDPRFGLTPEHAAEITEDATALWEAPSGIDLFTPDSEGPLTVLFVYDERQERVDEEARLRGVLEDKGSLSEKVRSQYETLLSEYSKLKRSYEGRVATYEQKLAAYNAEVKDWNSRGGAPKDVYERLSHDEEGFGAEAHALGELAANLNELARKMNVLAARGNSIVADYNETVETYNENAGEGEAFTQGEYHDRVITIFEYASDEELTLVLAHELGHALSLEHVDGGTSVMYYLMGAQTTAAGVSESDMVEFTRRCGDGTLTSRFVQVLKEAIHGVLG